MNALGPTVLTTLKQQKSIVDRITETFPEFAENR